MTKDDLARALDALDPGGRLPVERETLAALFGGSPEAMDAAAIEAFAEAHRCSFVDGEESGETPHFVKNDVF